MERIKIFPVPVTFLLLIFVLVISCQAQATPSTARNRILFVSDRDGNHEIYVMNSDGSNQTNLTNHEAIDFRPCWSPLAVP